MVGQPTGQQEMGDLRPEDQGSGMRSMRMRRLGCALWREGGRGLGLGPGRRAAALREFELGGAAAEALPLACLAAAPITHKPSSTALQPCSPRTQQGPCP
eukprot:188220-Chlamydomonas_euryale.AAC.6